MQSPSMNLQRRLQSLPTSPRPFRRRINLKTSKSQLKKKKDQLSLVIKLMIRQPRKLRRRRKTRLRRMPRRLQLRVMPNRNPRQRNTAPRLCQANPKRQQLPRPKRSIPLQLPLNASQSTVPRRPRTTAQLLSSSKLSCSKSCKLRPRARD